MKYVLALDEGTTSARALLFAHNGHIAGSSQHEFPQHYPSPGHVEHDPEDIWNVQLKAAREALYRTECGVDQVGAIGVTNQRETTILWERDSGKPVANAIVWQSRITAPLCEKLKSDGLEPLFREKTGLLIDPYFSGTKIRYLLDENPGLRSRAEKGEILFGTVDTFLIWRLTGGKQHITDVSNASRTLLYNIHTLDWDDELLRHLDVPRAMLPQVRASSEVYGETDPKWFGRTIPIAGCAGDQQAATFGQACFAAGEAKNTYGTGCFLLINTGDKAVPSTHGLLTTIGWKIGDQVVYCLEGAVFVAGAVVQWLRDELGFISNASEIEQLALQVPDSGDVFLVPAFVGLGAPYWDPHARGTIVGLTRGTTRAHIARAALDSIVLQTQDVLEAMQQDSGLPLESLRVDGGAAANDLLMQRQADVLGVAVRRPVVQETTALGAAYLAGLAVGFWKGREDLLGNWALDREFKPAMSVDERDRLQRRWREAVARSRHWASAGSV